MNALVTQTKNNFRLLAQQRHSQVKRVAHARKPVHAFGIYILAGGK